MRSTRSATSQLYDRNSNALPTITVDQVNRNVQYQYDSKGNPTKITFEDANEQDFTLQQRFRAADGREREFKNDEFHL